MDFFLTTIVNPQNYFFSWYALFHVTVCLIMAALTIIFIRRENFSHISVVFVLIVVPVIMWLLGNAVMFSSDNKSVIIWWAKTQNMGVIFLPSSMFLLTLAVINKLNRYKIISVLSFLLSAAFAILVSRTNTFLTGFYHYPWGYYCRYYSLPSTLYLLFFGAMGLFMIFLFVSEYRNVLSENLKKRYLAILALYLVSFFGLADFLIAFGISTIPPIGAVSTFISVIGAFVLLNRYEFAEVSAGFAAKEIIKIMDDILFLFNKDGIIQYSNASALEFFNLPEKELVGSHILQIIRDPRFSQDFQRLLKMRSFQDYEVSFTLQGSKKKFLNLALITIYNGLRQPLAFVCIAKDITEDKIAENALERAYAVPVRIIQGLPVGVIVTDQSRKVKQINKTGLKLLKLKSEKEILGKVYVVKEVEGPSAHEQISSSDSFQAQEAIIVSPQGKNIAVLKESLAFSLGDEDLLLDVLINISDRKVLEQQVQEYKEYLEKLVVERSEELKTANSQLINEVSERKRAEEELKSYICELENFQRIAQNRTNRLIELKKEANQLAAELGQPEKYQI